MFQPALWVTAQLCGTRSCLHPTQNSTARGDSFPLYFSFPYCCASITGIQFRVWEGSACIRARLSTQVGTKKNLRNTSMQSFSLRGPCQNMERLYWGPPQADKLHRSRNTDPVMVAEEVIITLSGGAPWGFRLQGGLEHQKPLQVAKVWLQWTT